MASFLEGPVVGYWRAFDEKVFFALNGSLDSEGPWTILWAWMNTRTLDVTWAVVMALPALWVIFCMKGVPIETRVAKILAIALAVVLAISLAKSVGEHVERDSPSRVLSPFHNLNDFVPSLKVKTESGESFPGDHGVAAFVYAFGFIFLLRHSGLTVIALFVTVANTLPRLFGGGHWVTDVIVGGGGFALLVIPLMLATPVVSWLEPISRILLDRFMKPILRPVGLENRLV
ncbi:phosphatase PAP2 family protein [Aestuariispira ectoiniformans]|uniref:phosphatase PAP2 family protein n=1 Tax=Aestuariispira ectoiniformans TaxID=2775080 RepID=UPI00223AD07F|nr:phosphatase PAP2 family protein [Aestuariispira ectoiniformans]